MTKCRKITQKGI